MNAIYKNNRLKNDLTPPRLKPVSPYKINIIPTNMSSPIIAINVLSHIIMYLYFIRVAIQIICRQACVYGYEVSPVPQIFHNLLPTENRPLPMIYQ